MFGSEFLEVAIGLIFVYLLLSLLGTTVNELIMTYLSSRGRELEKAIMTMLSDENFKGLGKKFYEHPLIVKFASNGKNRRPSYLSSSNFSKTLIDVLAEDGAGYKSLESIEAAISRMPDGQTKKLLATMARDAGGNIEKFRSDLETWFNEMMDRASGWYKRRVHRALMLIGFGIAIAFNADTFQIAKKLSIDPEARAKIVAMAENYRDKQLQNKDTTSVASAGSQQKIDSLNKQINVIVNENLASVNNVLGLGWVGPNAIPETLSWWEKIVWIIYKFPGWIITAFAITLGAPFWFDMLNKVVNIRNAGKKPEAKEEEKTPVSEAVVRQPGTINPDIIIQTSVHLEEETPAYG